MHTILYKSKAKSSFYPDKVRMMLVEAKAYNSKNGITGFLIYSKGHFLQLIQGDKKTILELYGRIELDNRHEDVTTIIDSECKDSLWSDWSMALYDLSGTDAENDIRIKSMELFLANAKVHKEDQFIFDEIQTQTARLLGSQFYTLS